MLGDDVIYIVSLLRIRLDLLINRCIEFRDRTDTGESW